jgi:type IV pilus assembly protein PilC
MEMTERQARLTKFWKKFLRMTRGRVTVLRTLEVIAVEEKDAAFKESVTVIRTTIEGGSTMSQAMLKHPDHFSPSIVELIKTAEKTGAWDEILQEIVDGLLDGTFE